MTLIDTYRNLSDVWWLPTTDPRSNRGEFLTTHCSLSMMLPMSMTPHLLGRQETPMMQPRAKKRACLWPSWAVTHASKEHQPLRQRRGTI